MNRLVEPSLYDCRVARYKRGDGRNDDIHITFYNGLQEIFSTGFIHAEIVSDRLYFVEVERAKKRYSVTVSGNKLKFSYAVSTPLYDFEGVYPLKYDSQLEHYYISLEDQESITYRDINVLGRKINVTSRTCKPNNTMEDIDMSTIIKPTTSPVRKTSAEKNAEQVVRNALLQLMEEQLKEEKCSEALATLTTLKNYI